MKLKVTNLLKWGREKYPSLYKFGKIIYIFIRPDITYKRYKYKKFKETCFISFSRGDKIIEKTYGGINAKFKAISKQNYLLLKLGNQGEDEFMGKIFDEHINEGNVILDIGAQTGMYTIPFAKKVGDNGKVFAFEPESLAFEAIKKNAILNSIRNIIPIKIVVTDKSGFIDFFIRPFKDTGSIFSEDDNGSPFGQKEKITIECRSVDDMIKSGLIEEPDFIKIDTEGAEIKILDGMKASVRKTNHILVEIHEDILRFNGISNPLSEIKERLNLLGFTKIDCLDKHHILASK